MLGVRIITTLLRGHQPVTALVPAKWIKGGRLPDNVTPPALLVRHVTQIERIPLVHEGWERCTARISVMVRAVDYRQQGAVIEAVRGIPQGALGTIGAALNVTVHKAGLGPDVGGPGGTYEQTQDFRVSFNARI